jgi:hypothetical protein
MVAVDATVAMRGVKGFGLEKSEAWTVRTME